MPRKQPKHNRSPIIATGLVVGAVSLLAGHEIGQNTGNANRVPPLKNVPSRADLGEATMTQQAEYLDAKRLEQTANKVSKLTPESVAKAKDVYDVASNIQDVLFGLHAKTGAEMPEIADEYLQEGVIEALNAQNIYFLPREDDSPHCFNMFSKTDANNVESVYVPYLSPDESSARIGEVVADPREQQRSVVGKSAVHINQ